MLVYLDFKHNSLHVGFCLYQSIDLESWVWKMDGGSLTERGGGGVQIVGDDIATGWVMGYGSQHCQT